MLEVLANVFESHMLTHPHARDLMKASLLPGKIAEVHQLHLALCWWLLFADAASRVVDLFFTERDAARDGAVLGARMQHEAAPTAADVEEPLIMPQIELAADQVH